MLRNILSLIVAVAVLVLARTAPLAAQTLADLSVTKDDAPDPVTAGSSLVYTITLSNEGPDDAAGVVLSDDLPAGTTFQSLSQPAGWSCTTPAVGAGGTVSCSLDPFAPGSAVFTLTVLVDPGLAAGTVLTNTATVTSATPDPNPGAESATATTTVTGATTTFSITKTGAPDPALAGGTLTYTLTAGNNSPGDLESAELLDTLPAGTTFVSLAPPAGWSCTTPAVGSGGTLDCTAAPFVPGDAVFTLAVQVDASLAPGTVLGNQGSLTVTDSGRSATQMASASTLVISPATLAATKTASGGFLPGSTVTYTVVLTNGGPSTQTDNPGHEFTDVLPSALTLVSATATTGTTTSNLITNTVFWDGSIPAGGSVTITITATINSSYVLGTTFSNQGTIAYDGDGNGTNESTALTDDPTVPGPADPTVFPRIIVDPFGIPTLDTVGLVLLTVLLALGGAATLRRRRT